MSELEKVLLAQVDSELLEVVRRRFHGAFSELVKREAKHTRSKLQRAHLEDLSQKAAKRAGADGVRDAKRWLGKGRR